MNAHTGEESRMSMVEQLTFDVRPHPALAGREDGGLFGATLAISGKYGMQRDLNPGDELTVTVANADGEVIAQGVAEVKTVGFAPVTLQSEVIGTERTHKAKLQ